MTLFKNTTLNNAILKSIKELGFIDLTPVQNKIIPYLLDSNIDLIVSAQTGTGKTAAFGLPIIQLTNIDSIDTQTLILSPTRELCKQIADDIFKYSKYVNGLKILSIYGGTNIEPQIKALKKGSHIVIGTPGRTKDLIKRKKLLLTNLDRIILDEADEMLTMGFKDDLDFILSKTPPKKQILLFSATMPKHILMIAEKYMENPVNITAEKTNSTPNKVNHIYYVVMAKNKYEVLKRIADSNPNIYGIVFCRTRNETKDIVNKLIQDGYNADALHGELSQAQRDEVMLRFRKNKLQMLVATDVAARGLDVDNLTHIINYNMPDDMEVYIHRSGRTGRAGRNGISISIIHTREAFKIKNIEKKYKIKFLKELIPNGKEICEKQLYSLIDKVQKVEVDEIQIEPFLPEIYNKLESLKREDLIKHFVSAEFNRFLSYYKNSRDINVSTKQLNNYKGNENKKTISERRKTPFSNLYINLGKNNKLNPQRLMGLINENIKYGNALIGKIDIKKSFSFFEIEKKIIPKLIKGLENKYFEGTKVSIELSKGSTINENSKKRKSSKNKKHNFKKYKKR